MNPYYQDDFVALYHGDCREILPTLGKFDLLLTDPPYGMDYQSCWKVDWQRKDKIYGGKEFPLWIFETDVNQGKFIFCRWDNLKEIPQPKSFIVWDKQRHSMGDLKHEFGRQWEAIAWYNSENHIFTHRPVDIISIPCVAPCDLLHPNEKPVSLIKKLISTCECKTILDPFAGSGTTGRAAKDLGRKCVMIEREEKYCEIAANRMLQECFKFEEA